MSDLSSQIWVSMSEFTLTHTDTVKAVCTYLLISYRIWLGIRMVMDKNYYKFSIDLISKGQHSFLGKSSIKNKQTDRRLKPSINSQLGSVELLSHFYKSAGWHLHKTGLSAILHNLIFITQVPFLSWELTRVFPCRAIKR